MTTVQTESSGILASRLSWLVDRAEIEDVFIRFFDALDYLRWDSLDEVFTSDVQGLWALGTVTDGREATVGYIRERFIGLGPTHHIMGNFAADIDGDLAPARCRARVYHVGDGPRSHLYEESLAAFMGHAVRTPQGWRFNEFSQKILIMLGTTDVFAIYNKDSA